MTMMINEKAEAKALTPDIAWPTLAYGALVVTTHWTLVWLDLSGRVPIWALTLPLGFTAYAHYTLVHEAVHRNMFAKRFKLDWLQDAIG